MSTPCFLISNGVVFSSADAPTVATLLQTLQGAYTTTRSDCGGSRLLFWERHLDRLCDSVRILSESHPHLLFAPTHGDSDFSLSSWDPPLRSRVNHSVRTILPIAAEDRSPGEELSVTALVSGNSDRGGVLDVHVHVGVYKPLVFGVRENGANLAVVGRPREAAEAKYSDWVRVRKGLENLRPPSATELLLSDDGDRILEGSVSNFFVVCLKDDGEAKGNETMNSFEVQTAPISEGALPGIIRRLVIEACLSEGISFREVAPSWSENEIWEEAFITNSLRLLQHTQTISVPDSWDSLDSRSWNEISWNTKKFEDCPGIVTRTIQRAVMEKAALEGYGFNNENDL